MSRHPSAASLNEAQRAAVEHGDGPLLVLAGPGSGKTRVVTHRIARLVERGVPALSVLAVTFTNKAAREMRDRVRQLVGKQARGLTIATFHSACVRILREEIAALGYSRDFSIYDESSQQSLVRTVLRDLRGPGGAGSASAVLAGLSQTRLGRTPKASAEPADPTLAAAAERYQEELRARNAVDFDDLILLTVRLFLEHPAALARWRERFRHVLVDEYQDTNASQDEVLRLLTGEHRNLCVVGDDDQSIYGWRGAEVDHILHFTRRYPEARVVKLERNYRSTGRIVAAASAVIARNAHRHAKAIVAELGPGDALTLAELPDEEEEADFIAQGIAKDTHAPGKDPWVESARHAVLLRTNEQARPIEQALRRARVPYRLVGGSSFFDRKEVQDVLAYLRVAANPADDEAFYRIANTPARGLGPAALKSLRLTAAPGAGTWSALEAAALDPLASGLAPRAAAGARELVDVVAGVRAAAARISPTLVTDLLAAVRYDDEIEKTYAQVEVRAARANLAREVQRAWQAYLADAPKPGLSDFLDSLALGDRDDDRGDGRGATIATCHAAKGLEFEAVWIAGVEEGLFPHARSLEDGRSLEEERRLFYVALTRARHRLTLTRCVQRTIRGRAVDAVPSRFLEEVPDELLERPDASAPASSESAASHLDRMRLLLQRPT